MSNRKQNDLEKLLKDKLSDKTSAAPDFVWDRIEAELFPEKKRRGFFWLFSGCAGLLIVAGCFTFCSIFSHEAKTAETHTVVKRSFAPHLREKKETKMISEHPGTGHSSGKGPIIEASAGAEEESFGARTSIAARSKQQERSGNSSFRTSLAGRSTGSFNESPLTSGSAEQPGILSLTGIPDPASSAVITELPVSDSSNTEVADPEIAVSDSIPVQPVDSAIAITTQPIAPLEVPELPSAAERKFTLSLYGGASLFDMAVFKDYLRSGQLSDRSFQSSGFEAGMQFSYQLTRKFGLYTGVAFNRKTTSFRYNLAISESDYFTVVLPGQLLPIAAISDNATGDCFLAEHVTANYQVNSWLLSLGTTYQVIRWKKLTLGIDLRFSMNLYSGLDLKKLEVIEVGDYAAERFNYIKPGAGLRIDYALNERLSVGLAPIYSLQFSGDNNSFYAGNVKELVIPVRVRIAF